MSIQKSKRAGIFILMACLLTGCQQLPFRNPLAGRQEPKLGDLPHISSSIQAPHVAWTTSVLAKQQRFSKLVPYIYQDKIYAADHTGKIVALDRNGKKLWSQSTHFKFSSGPTKVDNKLVFATSDAKLVAVDMHTGILQWETKVTSEVLALPGGGENIAFVHAIDGSVSAYNANNGEKLWLVSQSTPSLTLRFSSAPVIAKDKVLVGLASGKLVACNLQTGLIEWERTISLPRGRSELQRMVDISADPIIKDDHVYVITYQGKLAAVNIQTGEVLWDRDLSSYQNMALTGNTLLVTDNAHTLWAIESQSGNTLWKQAALADRYITGPAVIGNVIAVGDRGGYIHYISAQEGKLINRLHVSGKIYQGPVVMGHQFVVNSHNGKIAALESLPVGKA